MLNETHMHLIQNTRMHIHNVEWNVCAQNSEYADAHTKCWMKDICTNSEYADAHTWCWKKHICTQFRRSRCVCIMLNETHMHRIQNTQMHIHNVEWNICAHNSEYADAHTKCWMKDICTNSEYADAHTWCWMKQLCTEFRRRRCTYTMLNKTHMHKIQNTQMHIHNAEWNTYAQNSEYADAHTQCWMKHICT